MDAVIAWFGVYWWVVLLATGVAAKVANLVTKHWSEHDRLVRWCLFAIDLLDIVKSTPRPSK